MTPGSAEQFEASGHAAGYEAIEAELKAFEAEERKRLGLAEETVQHWIDPNPQGFSRTQRENTTILLGGLTLAHDDFVMAAFAGLGYRMKALDVADNEALRYGKEFGNRGQCNPTYFTVGNLVKYLVTLRDVEKMPVDEINAKYVFITAGACGPCRFGTYVTEYRKALRDAGFEGFRVLLFEQNGKFKHATGEDPGFEFNRTFFTSLMTAMIAADVVNLAGYRIRPYEVEPGATDRALDTCRQIVHKALATHTSVVLALYRCRRVLDAVCVDRLQVKPKVAIIGEFWAMTTEGDGNYKLQRFLEAEGAEVDIQPVMAWLRYSVWQKEWDTRRRMTLKQDDMQGRGLKGGSARKALAILKVADLALVGTFGLFCRAVGLTGYHLADMDEIASISAQYYDLHVRGGEGHMEVGKLIQNVERRKAHMVISVKPFGCMPSSGVSDGVQSLVTARHPDAIYCAIETTGDGAVNVQSRVLMDLFKARQRAQKEHEDMLDAVGLTGEEAKRKAARRGLNRALFHPPHVVAGTAANLIARLGGITRRARVRAKFARPPRDQRAAPATVRSKVGFDNGTLKLTPIQGAAGMVPRGEGSKTGADIRIT